MNGKTLADLSPWIDFHQMKSGTRIPYLKAEGLILTKRGSSREKDRADIGALTDISNARNVEQARRLDPGFRLDSVRSSLND
jgi:hypothetical protein